MARKLKVDIVLVWAALALLIVGLAGVYSASALRAQHEHKDAFYYLVRQALWGLMGIACLLVAMRIDYHAYRHRVVLGSLLGATTLGLLVVYVLPAVNGSHRWLGFGRLGIQPSEFAKIATIIFVAAMLEDWLERRELLKPVLTRIAAVLGVFIILIAKEPDYGSAAALAAIACSMLFVAGIAHKWVAAAVASAAIALPPLAYLVLKGYHLRRLAAFLDPWRFRDGDGFQVIQSFIAVGSGGVAGKGFMNGVQKMQYLPYPHNDFIYAVIGEETGLIGATVVLLLFAMLAWRGLRAARRAPDSYGALLATGITALLVLQAFVNMSVVLGLLPAKGIALPFVSAGGSSMAASFAAMGILLNVSQHGVDD
jgi:cell division protein FtsW